MDPNTSHVKPKRSYDSVRRREQARQTREAILDTAQRLFLSDGFAPTTIAAIAQGARVSVDTVYKTFGGKPGLVRAICQRALAGEQPVPAEVRSDALQASEPDPRAIIRGWGKLTTEIAPRVAPILLLLRTAAAADPDMAALQSELNAQRLQRMTRNARNLAAAHHLRENLTIELAGEIMWTYSSPELYELLVLTRGWPLERYGAFLADAMITHLLPAETASTSSMAAGCPQRHERSPA
ncbi:MAG TPA: TetR/AcrR family transcriptional regulator [Solirubrobacteraceae bacterium]|nr:TetR/AcrR family transcriptional regulator [Solirubrobacteraceae bacterium]